MTKRAYWTCNEKDFYMPDAFVCSHCKDLHYTICVVPWVLMVDEDAKIWLCTDCFNKKDNRQQYLWTEL